MFGFDILDFLIIALIFSPLERLAPTIRGQKVFRKLLLLDLFHVVFTGMLITGGVSILLLMASYALKGSFLEEISPAIQAQPVWIQFFEILLIADLIFYTAHRAFHKISFLWQFHAVHHSIQEMDWLAAHRVHPFDQTLTKGLSIIPVILLGFSPTAIALFILLYKWQSLLIHSNINVPFGPFRWVLASPVFHHWHHANEAEALDTNFAGQLPFLDLLFGSAYMPRHKAPQKFGTNDPVPDDYLGQLAYPIRRWISPQNSNDESRERIAAAE